MKNSSKSSFKMTQTQLAILGGLGVLAFLLVFGVGFMIFSNLGTRPEPPLPPAAQVVSSPTILNTIEAAPPTPTITPTEEIIPTPALPATAPAGWVKFQSPGAELWLPNNFVGGDMTSKRNATIQKVAKLGEHFADIVTLMKESKKDIILFMTDNNITDVVIMLVRVQHKTLKEDVPLAEYIKTNYVSAGNIMVAISENKKMTLLGHEARRVTYQVRMTYGVEATAIDYIIKDGLEYWFISYSMPPARLLDLMPMVEDSIATFNITK